MAFSRPQPDIQPPWDRTTNLSQNQRCRLLSANRQIAAPPWKNKQKNKPNALAQLMGNKYVKSCRMLIANPRHEWGESRSLAQGMHNRHDRWPRHYQGRQIKKKTIQTEEERAVRTNLPDCTYQYAITCFASKPSDPPRSSWTTWQPPSTTFRRSRQRAKAELTKSNTFLPDRLHVKQLTCFPSVSCCQDSCLKVPPSTDSFVNLSGKKMKMGVVDCSPFTGLVDQCCKADPQPTVYNTGL